MIYAHQSGTTFETLTEHISKCKKMYNEFDLQNKWTDTLKNYFRTIFQDEELALVMHWLTDDLFVYHDFGKRSDSFQYKLGKSNTKTNSGDHALPSAVAFLMKVDKEVTSNNYVNSLLLSEWGYRLAFVISSHHSNLDNYHAFEDKIESFCEKPTDIHLEWFKNKLSSSLVKNHVNYDIKFGKISSDDWECLRFILGILCLCDYYATTEFMDDKSYILKRDNPTLTRQNWYWENKIQNSYEYLYKADLVSLECAERFLLDDLIAGKISKIVTVGSTIKNNGLTFIDLDIRFLNKTWNTLSNEDWSDIWFSNSRISCMRFASLSNAGFITETKKANWLQNYSFSKAYATFKQFSYLSI
jgi:CRISPR-associated endonuclease Cas3-HD